MITLELGAVAKIVGGRLVAADPGIQVRGPVEYDSRKAAPGGLFLALPGARVDGHDYVPAALAAGCVAALVTRPVAGPHIVVADGVAALSALASAVARRLTATVVGITGSSGKTSTKDLVAHLLPLAGPTVAAAGSMNNELGLPYTVLRANEQTRFLVLELGARGVGHIRWLAEIAPPRIGAVLNVGSAHLGEFGSREAIAAAKAELVEALPDAARGGVAVLNADDPLVRAMAARTTARVVSFGAAGGADVGAAEIRLDDGGRPSFTLRTGTEAVPVALQLVGAHHIPNALAAAAIALEAGLAPAAIAGALGTARAVSPWRMALTERADGVLVVNDAYNANPESMRAGLRALVGLAAARRGRGGRSFAVLGEMAELGPDGPAEHESLGRFAAELDLARLVVVGEAAAPIRRGAVGHPSWTGTVQEVPDAAAALDLLRAELRAGDVVLVKASRAASLERVALTLAEDDQCGRAGSGPGAARAGGDEA
ncbi:MAG TPA: UDP-N-acetylmuramoyl-tripeptide--D-alanyl-D-alanine ligase [Pseudonocardia sp.]|nr:UDP-N-acetylmuramoyl-tripeptide--D-alanyl-D-alanine ligase [Pseudonocardia sp.]